VGQQTDQFQIRFADWNKDQPTVRSIREQVFIKEQNVPRDLEWDGLDSQCLHIIAVTHHGSSVGTARLSSDGHIGRMAVLKPWREKGIGRLMLDVLLDAAAKRGIKKVKLNSQLHAISFYEKAGFKVHGRAFLDAGIMHKEMWRSLI